MQSYSALSLNLSNKNRRLTNIEEETLDRYHPDVAIVFDALKGAILVARRNLLKGETILSAVTCRIPDDVRRELKRFDFYKYVFVDPEEFRKSSRCCDGFIAFGSMSFCNHSENPNAEVAWETVSDRPILHLKAREHIPENTEITMRYANLPEYIGSEEWK